MPMPLCLLLVAERCCAGEVVEDEDEIEVESGVESTAAASVYFPLSLMVDTLELSLER